MTIPIWEHSLDEWVEHPNTTQHRFEEFPRSPIPPFFGPARSKRHHSCKGTLPRGYKRSRPSSFDLRTNGFRMLIAILFVIVVLLPTFLAWRTWLGRDQQILTGMRKVVFTIGLCVATLSLLEFLTFALYTNHIGGFGTDFPALFRWTRPGFWVSVLAFLLLLGGQSKSRAFGLTAAFLMIILWIVPVWGM